MSDFPENFTCPLCGNVLNYFIRIPKNTHVVFCSRAYSDCEYVEGSGENFREALADIQKKAKGKQKTLL